MASLYSKLYTFITLSLLATIAQATEYRIHNSCPASVNLYIGGEFECIIGTGESMTKLLSPSAGFFYTDTHGGFANGSATRAGFFGDYQYYYIVKDPEHFNTGISITPQGGVTRMGYCGVAECADKDCNAFTQPPTRFPPPITNQAPDPPLHSCPFGENVSFDITFCPSTGNWPGEPRIWHIHPDFNHINKCVDARGEKFENGTPVQIYDCDGSPGQNWYIDRGSTKIQLANTDFCLDAGSHPANGVGMKIWKCYENLPAQQWYYTDDNRIAVEGQGQCLDLTNGYNETPRSHTTASYLCPRSSYQYVITNRCPTNINLYIGGTYDSTIPVDGTVTRNHTGSLDFYTDANGGNSNGQATRAGFHLDEGYYYIVKDTSHFNTGISIAPRSSPNNGFCTVAECDSVDCSTAYSQPPTSFPPTSSSPPSPPLHRCNVSNIDYDITFCPTNGFPGQPSAFRLHPGLIHPNKCLDVRGANYTDGTPVQIYDCNSSGAQNWVIQRGSTKVRVANTNFCLDAGSAPANGVKMKIWQCYDNLPAQQWYYTNDNRIALENHGQCLYRTDGIVDNGKQVQIWECANGNTNQIWTE